MKRPYIQKSSNELFEIIENCSSLSDLSIIENEVKSRKKYPKKQKQLYEAVEQKRAILSQTGSDRTTPEGGKANPPPSTPSVIGSDPKSNGAAPKKGKIRAPSNNLAGTPDPWYPDNSDEPYKLRDYDPSDAHIKRYISLLSALVWEIRNNKAATRPIVISNGRRNQIFDSQFGYAYQFTLDDADAEIIEGIQCQLIIGARKIDANIISFIRSERSTLTISVSEDLGEFIETAGLVQDHAAFYETLGEQLKAEINDGTTSKRDSVGINSELASDLVNGLSRPCKFAGSMKFVNNLNSQQKTAVQKSLKNTVTFIWGPPGTGKTQTLGALVANYIASKERTLVASNTNQAVDQILLKICRQLKEQRQNDMLENGYVVRIGKIANQELEQEFSDYVQPEKIAERLSQDLKAQMDELEKQIAAGQKEVSKFELLNQDLENAKISLENKNSQLQKIKNINETLSEITRDKINLESETKSISTKIETAKNRTILGKMFGPSIESLEDQLALLNRKLADAESQITQWSANLSNEQRILSKLEAEVSSITFDERKYNENKNAIEAGKNLLAQLRNQQESIRKEINELADKIVAQATILGTTVTKAFMSPVRLGKFENVIIDEASMVLIPAMYFTAGLSLNRVTISGDFRQLPPIVQSRHPIIQNEFGNDIFTIADVRDAFIEGQNKDHCATLELQYRMDKKICDLISEIGYGGRLLTANEQKSIDFHDLDWLNERTIIIDTGTIGPFLGLDGNSSRSNVAHAAACKSLTKEILKSSHDYSIGICAPYRAQIKLLQNLINDEKATKPIQIGTVHTYQGDEKDILIFDSVESYGAATLPGLSLNQVDPERSNILTVAVSRARSALILVANLQYLDSRLPAQSYFRKILYQAQQHGRVIDVKEFLGDEEFHEYRDLLSKNINFAKLDIDISDLDEALVREKAFYPLLNLDLEQATKSVVVYSGFYGPNRMETMLPSFKNLIKRGIKIKCVIPPPDNNGSLDEVSGRQILSLLEKTGVAIEYRQKIHQKAVLIDDNVVWFGSLNPLSFSGSTHETMLRLDKPKLSYVFAENFSTHSQYKNIDTIDKLVEVHNPSCSKCGQHTVAKSSKYGKYFQCINCGDKANFR